MLKKIKNLLDSARLKNLNEKIKNLKTHYILLAIALFIIAGYIISSAGALNFQDFSSRTSRILVDNNKMKFSLKQGEVMQYPMRLTNVGTLHSYFNIVVEAFKNLVVPNKKSFDIEPKQAEDIAFIAFAPYNEAPGVYESTFIIQEVKNVKETRNIITNNVVREERSANNIIKVIYSLMDISTKNALFDVTLKPVRISKNIIAVGVEINNKGAPSPADVRFELYAKKVGGDIIESRNKRIAIDKSIEFGELMNLTEDKFIVYSKLRHNGEVLVSSAFFDESATGKKQQQASGLYSVFSNLASNGPYILAFVVIGLLAILFVQRKSIIKSKNEPKKATATPMPKPEQLQPLTKLKSRLKALEKTSKSKKTNKKKT